MILKAVLPSTGQLTTAILIWLVLGCAQDTIPWPQGTGYVSAPANKPSQPHGLDERTSTAYIHGVTEDGLLLYGLGTGIAIRQGADRGASQIISPGSTLIIRTVTGEPLKIPDFNGDECVLPQGIHVFVDEYGQFVPVRRDSDLDNVKNLAMDEQDCWVAPPQKRANQ